MKTNGRTTKQLADDYLVKPETVLRRYSTTGSYFGLLPTKLPNGRLLWPPKQEGAA